MAAPEPVRSDTPLLVFLAWNLYSSFCNPGNILVQLVLVLPCVCIMLSCYVCSRKRAKTDMAAFLAQNMGVHLDTPPKAANLELGAAGAAAGV